MQDSGDRSHLISSSNNFWFLQIKTKLLLKWEHSQAKRSMIFSKDNIIQTQMWGKTKEKAINKTISYSQRNQDQSWRISQRKRHASWRKAFIWRQTRAPILRYPRSSESIASIWRNIASYWQIKSTWWLNHIQDFFKFRKLKLIHSYRSIKSALSLIHIYHLNL